MEHKTTTAFETKIVDEDQGIVETVFGVSGVLDDGNDVLHPGAFSKTFMERGSRVRVLDQHRTDSIMAVIAKPLAFKELGRNELPERVLANFPEATGGVWARAQFLLDTPEGKGAFARIKAGAVDEWSYGYDAMQTDYSPVLHKDGTVINARNLREVKLYELSPVLWGMNPATATVSAKGADMQPDEGKPWRAIRGDDGKWRVYKLDADGQATGETLGEHESEEEAQAQVRALYASEADKGGQQVEETKVKKTEADGEHPAAHYLVVEDNEKPSTWHLRVRDAAGKPDHGLMGAAWAALHGGYRGNTYEGPGKQEAIHKLTALYESEGLETPKKAGDMPEVTGSGETEGEHKAGRVLARRNAERLQRALAELQDTLKDAGLLDLSTDNDSETEQAEQAEKAKKAAGGPDVAPPTPSDGAGPDAEPPSYKQAIDELAELELDILNIETGG